MALGLNFACMCCSDAEEDHKYDLDYLELAQNNFYRGKLKFMEHLEDLRVMSLLSSQQDEKIKLFDRVKMDCTLVDSFTVPLYYFEKEYSQLLKIKSNNLEFLEIYNNISKVDIYHLLF